MKKIQFAVSEYCFPVWGSMAVRMAAEAGFDGIEITDGGGYLQPHPDNNGYVEYERLGLDMTRQDCFPLTDLSVQKDYTDAAAEYGIKITGIFMYLLENQGFVKNADATVQGRHCLQTIANAVKCAKEMGIPSVTLSARGLFGTAQYEYTFQKIKYAAEEAENAGIKLYVISDRPWQDQKEVLDRTGRKALAAFATQDPAAAVLGDPAAMIHSLGREYIGQIRVKDIKADEHGFVTKAGQPALLGEGDTGFAVGVQAVKELGYEGWIISETPYYSGLFSRIGQDFTEAAEKDLKTLKDVFGEE